MQNKSNINARKRRKVISLDLTGDTPLMLDRLVKMRNAQGPTLIRMLIKAEYDRFFNTDGSKKGG